MKTDNKEQKDEAGKKETALTRRISKVSEKKQRTVAELVKLMDENRSVMIVSTKNVPSQRLQKMRKELKDANIKVVKKNIMLKALGEAKKDKIKGLSNYVVENFAVLFSNLEPFELSSALAKQKSKIKARAGQIAPFDLIIEAGPTDLAPMFMSDLVNVGIKTKMEGGKVVVKESFVLVRKGGKISLVDTEILSKLSMEPFTTGLEPIAAYYSEDDIVYTELKIDTEAAIERLIKGMREAFKLALKIVYPAKETIKLILAKALAQANALQNKIKQ